MNNRRSVKRRTGQNRRGENRRGTCLELLERDCAGIFKSYHQPKEVPAASAESFSLLIVARAQDTQLDGNLFVL